ncbi:putative viral replication protein [Clostridium sp. BL-8]|nr:putative viral replication protein [Clostridium sp. BL-8]
MSDEVGENGTYHTHVYFCLNNATRFSTVKNKFNGPHIEPAKGTSQQNRDYVFKEGKWENDKKKETNLADTHEEYGEMPYDRQGYRSDLEDLYDMIKSGMTTFDILEDNPSYMLQLDKIDRVRTIYLQSKYKSTRRLNLEVTYVYGTPGTGKTRSIMDFFGDDKVFRITDYKHPFDNYQCQDVVVFEEFRSDLKVQDMLNYLDVYPLELPSRYSNKIACYTKVFIVTNISLEEQYEGIQKNFKDTWKAFLRRIHKVIQYTTNNVYEYTLQEYLDRDLTPVDDKSPFEQEKMEV